jgi:hypothetical protein
MSLEGVASLSQRRENCSNYKPELVAALGKNVPTTILKGKHRGLREQRQAEQTKAISTDVCGRILFKQSIGGEWYYWARVHKISSLCGVSHISRSPPRAVQPFC